MPSYDKEVGGSLSIICYAIACAMLKHQLGVIDCSIKIIDCYIRVFNIY